jgi:hypothetical protein
VVVDLESANGVRVNGAEYERVELQSGDVLELGHVRLRFATADDAGGFEGDFRFGGNRKPLYIGLGAAAVAAVGAFLLFAGKSEPPKLPPPPAAKVAVVPIPPPAPAAPSEPATGLPPPKGAEAVAGLLANAKKAYDAQKWGDALVLVDQAVKASPTDTENADELRKAIEAEQLNAAKYDALQHASNIKEYEAVLRGAPEISDGSFYKPKARALEEEARGKLIARHLDTAERRRTEGNCAEAKKSASAVLAIDAENQAAQDLIARCGKPTKAPAVVATPAPAPATPKPSTPRPIAAAPASRPVAVAATPTPRPTAPAVAPPPTAVTPPAAPATPKPVAVAAARPPATPKPASARPAAARTPSEGPAPSSADGDALMQEAQDAWLKGQYSAAIDASRKALRAKPGLTRAYQIIAVCSCSLRDAESANKAYERLDDRNKQLVKQLCAKSGITID